MLYKRADLPPHLQPLGKGKCVSILIHADSVIDLTGGYWDGGSKSVYVLAELATGKTFSPEVDLTNPFKLPHGVRVQIPPGYAIVESGWFCGKERESTFHIGPATILPALPPAPTVSEDEAIVLKYITSYKSSYAGISNYRKHRAIEDRAITGERWEAARAALIERKILNRAGAITTEGRLLVSQTRFCT